MHYPKYLVIIGSVRSRRIGPDVAAWVADIGRETLPATFELVDLRDWSLPMDVEPGIPAHDPYQHTTTKAWSARISGADGYMFVTPQYNWGYPAPLKNAIDHLYAEWRGKPAAVITYGGHGGGKCAAQLREVLSGLKMQLTRTMPALVLPREQVEANPGSIDADTAFVSSRDTVIATLRELHALTVSVKRD